MPTGAAQPLGTWPWTCFTTNTSGTSISDMVLAPDALSAHLSLMDGSGLHVPGTGRLRQRGRGAVGGLPQHARPAPQTRRRGHPVHPVLGSQLAGSLGLRPALGGFDPRFEGYGGEDFDFAYRLERMSGEPLVNNKKSVAMTMEPKTIERALAQFEEYGSTNLHLLESIYPDSPRTFELQRLDSTAFADRVFVATLNPIVERVVDLLIRIGPRRLRNQLLNYKLISAVWRGYRSTPCGPMKLAILGSRGIPPPTGASRRSPGSCRASWRPGVTRSPSTRTAAAPTRRDRCRLASGGASCPGCAASTWRP